MTVLEEVIMFTFQQSVYYLTKVCWNSLIVFLQMCNTTVHTAVQHDIISNKIDWASDFKLRLLAPTSISHIFALQKISASVSTQRFGNMLQLFLNTERFIS